MKKLLLLALLAGLIQIPGITFAMEKESPDEIQELDVADLEEASICLICNKVSDDNHRLVKLGCNHVFGIACITSLISWKDPQCPSCKKTFSLGSVEFSQ